MGGHARLALTSWSRRSPTQPSPVREQREELAPRTRPVHPAAPPGAKAALLGPHPVDPVDRAPDRSNGRMSHPFEALPAGRRPRVFLPLLAATLVVWAAAAVIDRPLETPAAPLGIRPLLDDDRPGVWAAGVLRARRWPLAAVGVPLGVRTV